MITRSRYGRSWSLRVVARRGHASPHRSTVSATGDTGRRSPPHHPLREAAAAFVAWRAATTSPLSGHRSKQQRLLPSAMRPVGKSSARSKRRRRHGVVVYEVAAPAAPAGVARICWEQHLVPFDGIRVPQRSVSHSDSRDPAPMASTRRSAVMVRAAALRLRGSSCRRHIASDTRQSYSVAAIHHHDPVEGVETPRQVMLWSAIAAAPSTRSAQSPGKRPSS